MPEIRYINKNFSDVHESVIWAARGICEDFASQGYDLTLRQLYYQFVANDLFPDDWTWAQVGQRWVKDPQGTKNAEPNYKRLGSIINDARLAGCLDWDYIVDRTRNLESLAHWNDPVDIIKAVSEQYRIDKWADQDCRVEVWIEKDALIGVLESACPQLDVPYFSCRGYTSQSEVWGAAQRLGRYIIDGQRVVVVHLGDHDPSGIDMTRDIEARLSMFIAIDIDPSNRGGQPDDYIGALDGDLTVHRVALNMDQIREYDPPPNPAKLSDSRGASYVDRYGESSWELDALSPATLVGVVQDAVVSYRDDDRWEAAVARETDDGEVLRSVHERWDDVKEFVR